MTLGRYLGKVLMSAINTGDIFAFVIYFACFIQNFFFLLHIKFEIHICLFWFHRSIIFVNGSDESRLAAVSKEREQMKSRNSIVTTQIQQLGTFYPAEPEHQVCVS